LSFHQPDNFDSVTAKITKNIHAEINKKKQNKTQKRIKPQTGKHKAMDTMYDDLYN